MVAIEPNFDTEVMGSVERCMGVGLRWRAASGGRVCTRCAPRTRPSSCEVGSGEWN